jgi:DNA-binding transcriptional LysR family regulator
MQINLRQIEVFRAVMSTGSISGASRLLHVSQPAVSRLLAYTESRIGFALFDRVKGRLFPTPEARRLFDGVEEVYQGVRRVNELAHDLAMRQGGALHVLSSPSVGQMIIPRAVEAFRRAHPGVHVTFQFAPYESLLDRVVRHQADLGILILPVSHPNLEVRSIGRARMVCLLPYNHPLARQGTLTLADLQPFDLIGYDRDTPFGRLLVEMHERAGLPLDTAMTVGSPLNACAFVQAGAGVALVDEFSVHSWPAGNFVVRPLAEAPHFDANLLYSRFEPLSQRAQAFVQTLQAMMAEEGFVVPAADSAITAG